MNNTQEKTYLTVEFIRFLKKSAHHLNPVVQFGKKGVNEALLKEIDQALEHHELIKIRVAPDQKEIFKEALDAILQQTCAHHVDTIGNVVILFRKNDKDSQYGPRCPDDDAI